VGKSADAFRTISEAAAELSLPQHVLRFWETRFTQIKPLKRGGGRRYYRPEDILLLKGICHLLYEQGFTIKGVQRILKEDGPRHVIAIGEAGSLDALEQSDVKTTDSEIRQIGADSADSARQPVLNKQKRDQLTDVLGELLACKRMLDNAREG